ncbi:SAM-dependent methyltransferase, MidA family [Salinihabitans flavidus]|uniref:SAM-dependent methyltransferase, MidA family n=1 Tax=Salinihabitans flavidus TaxID=569882 RepID=A0A1H8P496_9RHOB|nr:SAM-dependent methyltransferase [Salinihabitans flavidus]SEO36353.1 SAM-dependent methyltransferase, MidA family [Salinihabitans flavidus]
MTPLAQELVARVAAQGPLTVAEFMADCLLHPRYGYYATRDPLGAKGDFTTAPEISQMFGEMLGLALAQAWMDQGRPAPFTLAELGPGRGTLMADILRAARNVPGFHDAAALHLVEASEPLRTQQRTLLGSTPTWHDSLDTLPDQPLFLVANEFFDALPTRQFLREGAGWRERLIGAKDGQLAFGLGEVVPQPALTHRMEDTHEGDLVEVCSAAVPIAMRIGAQIAARGGTAMIIDYGDWSSLGDTLQALRGHRSESPLDNPGEADLTVHVDFEAIARAAPCAHSRLTPQGVFLERLGITQRAQALSARLSGEALQSHVAAHRRLTHPGEMGNLFKTLALYPKGATPPPGYAQ